MCGTWGYVVLVALLCLCVARTQAQYADMGLAFNETMSGYQATGNISYEEAYEQGKAAHQVIFFKIRSTIASMAEFVEDPSHQASVIGTIYADGITSSDGAVLGPSALLQIYDNGVQDGVMYLHYFLPFIGANGQAYHLEGIKYVWGNECIHFLAEMTTLYLHIRNGSVRYEGDILTSGIAKIPVIQVAALVASFKFIGNGTDADKMNTAVLFAAFLLRNIQEDCFNISTYETNFWYVWFSDPLGGGGFLLDLIQHPSQLELRLEVYSPPQLPLVLKDYLPLTDLLISGGNITMGSTELTPTSCTGSVNGTAFNLTFALSARTNQFVPADFIKASLGLLPNFESLYGTLKSASYGNFPARSNIPFVYSRYSIRFDLDVLKWAMISAMAFPGSDLQIEMLALGLTDSLFLPSVYIYYNGTSHSMSDPFVPDAHMHTPGSLANNERIFAASIDTLSLKLSINCSAPVDQFALLDTEGQTQIHTTLVGLCYVTDLRTHTTLVSKSALLEVKLPIGR